MGNFMGQLRNFHDKESGRSGHYCDLTDEAGASVVTGLYIYIYIHTCMIYIYIYIWSRVPCSYPPNGMGPQVALRSLLFTSYWQHF